MKRFVFPALCLSILAGGCSTHFAKFTVLSTRNLVIENQEAELVASGVEGSSIVTGNAIFASGRIPEVDDAVENVLLKYDGDYLANAEVRSEFYFFLLFSSYGYTVKGDVMKLKEGAR